MTDLGTLKALNTARWGAMKINPDKALDFLSVAKRLTAPSAWVQYAAVSLATNVPADFIAVVHERESNQRFDRSLAQGDPWNRVSTHVPKGRGPFDSWEDAAIDALVNCAPFAARNTDWSIGGKLTMLEQYNGLGYFKRSLPSPYLWAGTDQYVRGKYTADGVFDPHVVDQQLGCAGLLQQIDVLRATPPPETTDV